MKRIVSLYFLLFLSLASRAQKAEVLMEKLEVNVLALKGHVFKPINIPPNAISIAIRFNCYRKDGKSVVLSSSSEYQQQLNDKIKDFNVSGSANIKKIFDVGGGYRDYNQEKTDNIKQNSTTTLTTQEVPEVCNVFITDIENATKFSQYKPATPYYYGYSQNAKSGTLTMNKSEFPPYTTFQVCVLNPLNKDIFIEVDVIAITSDDIPKEKRQQLYDGIKKSIEETNNKATKDKMTKSQVDDLAYCFTQKILDNQKKSDFNELAEFEKNKLLERMLKDCAKELNITLPE